MEVEITICYSDDRPCTSTVVRPDSGEVLEYARMSRGLTIKQSPTPEKVCVSEEQRTTAVFQRTAKAKAGARTAVDCDCSGDASLGRLRPEGQNTPNNYDAPSPAPVTL